MLNLVIHFLNSMNYPKIMYLQIFWHRQTGLKNGDGIMTGNLDINSNNFDQLKDIV